MNTDNNRKKNHEDKGQFLKYSGFAFQLFFTMFVAGYIGGELDKMAGWDKMYLTAIFILLVFFAFIYKLMKDL